ncbi:winged helix-turn-helix domain-containing protein [Winogradskyella sp.]|uniref:winged helix-turn-helix domain-containing protein n=1 Tax=Winogradskyella sp. TaxID=1883156 RepID=UPI00262EB7B7|nr:winged helix-turn-helix domain-containing protein [Winogradskyella sp.]
MKYCTGIRFLIIILVVCFTSCNSVPDDFSKQVKIALRDAGNKLLLSENDSTSLILPVKELRFNKYQLTFNAPLTFEPEVLVGQLKESLTASKLPEHYIVEVIQCKDNEVAYSYQMSTILESTIIPCAGRYLPKACYVIEVNFFKRVKPNSELYFVIGLTIALLVVTLASLWYWKTFVKQPKHESINYEAIGAFKFYPEQNKLIKEAEEIALSKKECELLALFVARPNEVIKRDELTKKVWEDNGVFVGRSLDTYISKLRKKLKSDASIKLTNVHGVGYKLEIL